LFNSIREAFEAADPPNPETVAMADLYKADWELAFGNKSTESSYAQAFEGLLASGVSLEALHCFFDQPKLLPINNSYLTVEQALWQNQQESSVVNLSLKNDSTNSFQFNEWSIAFSNTQYPLNSAPLFFDDSGPLNIATFFLHWQRWIKSPDG